ncbi:MAG: PKD domain-containing protein [Kiloniellaceae bacterium]
MDNSSQPRRVWRRNGLKIAATALLIGAWAPGTAQANGTAGLLGLVAGMFGFEKPIDEPVRDAETSRLELRPATGPAPAAAPSRAVDLLAPMRTLLPAPGEWRLVTGTDFDRIRQSDTAATALGVRGSKGSTAVLSNLNGAAYDPGSDSMYFWGGGDTSYGGNEVYQLDMQTLGLSVTANASPLDRTVTGNGGIDCPVPTGGPAASSTYDGIVWSPSTQTFFVFPTTVFCTATSARATSVWEFDPVSGTWSVVTGLGDITGPVFAEYDPATDKIIVVGSGTPATVRTLDPVTGSMTASLSLGSNLASTGGSAVLRPGADDLLLVSQEGVFSVALSPLGTMRALAPLPSDVNPHSGLVYDVGLGVLVLWDGSKTVRTFNPDTLEWTAQTAALGPVSANGDVFSKWVYVDDLGIFAGYHESSEGLWLYRLPLVIGSSPPANTAPIADAGANRTQAVGSRLSLSGANSLDPDGDTLRYYWSVTSRPAGSAAALANPSSSSPSIVPDVLGTYVIQLSVGDGSLSDTDTITITAVNTTPVANAGVNQTLATGQTAFLDGSASFDGNGDPLTYAWTLVSKPAGSGASLSGNTTRTPSIVLDVAGAFLIQLVVNDGIQSGAPDTVTIAATAPVSSAPPPPVASTPPIDPGDLSLLASKLPARGQWALVPNTMFDNVRLRSSDGFPVEGDSRGVLSKWNGMAFDPTNHVMYFYGGGHHGYGGNEV